MANEEGSGTVAVPLLPLPVVREVLFRNNYKEDIGLPIIDTRHKEWL